MGLTPYLNFRRQFSKKNLKILYEDISINSGATGLDGINHLVFSKKLNVEIDTIVRKVFNETYTFTQYKEKLILKGANKPPRQISIPSIRDRICLKAISKCLGKTYEKEINFEIPQIKIEKLKRELESGRYTHFIKVDIQNFYPSINHDVLDKILKRKFRKDLSRNLFLKALKTQTTPKPDKSLPVNEHGVPQGLSISNILSEIYISSIDKLMEKQECFYLRYVDDVLILCNENDVKPLFELINKNLKKIHLNCHELGKDYDKTHTGQISSGFTYLGYTVKGQHISIKKANIRKFESSIAKLFTTYKYKVDMTKSRGYSYAIENAELNKIQSILEWRLNLRITGCIFEDAKRGWVFYFSQINDLRLLHEIDATIQSMANRFGVHGKIRIKRLVKTYHEAKVIDKEKYKYIINFDTYDVEKKRKTLEMYLGATAVSRLNDTKVNNLFGKRMSEVIKELEKDIGSTS